MIAAISMMRRRADVSLTQFRRHWLDVHGPLVCKFAGLQHYVQDHVIESPVMNRLARDMGIDGFPILQFDNDEARAAAHGSPEMAACNIDSRHFIGAVTRVMCDQRAMVEPGTDACPIKLIALLPGVEPDNARLERFADWARARPGLRGLATYTVLQQGAAPNSTIAHLPVYIAGALSVSFASLVDLECAMADDTSLHDDAALFVVEEHRLA